MTTDETDPGTSTKRKVNRKSKKFAALYRPTPAQPDVHMGAFEIFTLDADTTAKAWDEISKDESKRDGEYTVIQICDKPRVKTTETIATMRTV